MTDHEHGAATVENLAQEIWATITAFTIAENGCDPAEALLSAPVRDRRRTGVNRMPRLPQVGCELSQKGLPSIIARAERTPAAGRGCGDYSNSNCVH